MRIWGLAAAIVACGWTGAAQAADCKPLNILSSLDMTPLGQSELMTIPISLNGAERQFLLDTGGVVPQVSAAVANALKLPQHKGNIELYAADGTLSNTAAVVHEFAIGKLRASNFDVPISPNGDALDGIFSPASFTTYDFEMNFAARKMNILSGDHCAGKVIYWPAQALAVVPIKIRNLHVTVPVKLDGKDFDAIIDTGASTSIIRQDMARLAFGLTPDSPDVKPEGHLGEEERAKMYSYPFKTLTFEGVTISNPKVRILADVMGTNADRSNKMNSLIQRNSDDVSLPEVIIGMNVLAKLHLYFAFQEHKLYITEAGAAPAK